MTLRHRFARSCLFGAAALVAGAACAEEVYPRPGWTNAPNPITSPEARPGGEFVAYAGSYPKSFNYYLYNDKFTADLFGAQYETLITRHPLTLEYEPNLAARWTVSDDRRTFTFWLDPRARWSDGRPVTAGDVCWTFGAIMDTNNLTGPNKVLLATFDRPVALASNVVRFTAHEVHWRNLMAVGEMLILPAHVMANQDFNKINFEFPVVSGPYRLGEVRENLYVDLERRADWWQRGFPSSRGFANFQRLRFRFFAEPENAFEAFRKGDLDLYPVYMARLWVKETAGERYDRNWIVKQRVFNANPVGFQGFAMNLRRPLFQDRRVRLALAHLLDRERLNATLMYNQYFLHRSYFEDLYDAAHPCTNALIGFDPEAARRLLKAAGWVGNPRTGLLEKNGKPFVIRFLSNGGSIEKFLAIYAEALRDAGIQLKIDQKDWAAWAKDMEDFAYDMTWAAYTASVFKDPEGMWYSREADRPHSSNICGFRDPRVDALIDEQAKLFDVQARNAIDRRIDAILTEAVPCVLLWNINYRRLLYWNKFGMPPTVLAKYGDESDAYGYWWADPDSAADLKDAMATGRDLPARPADVHFDEALRRQAGR